MKIAIISFFYRAELARDPAIYLDQLRIFRHFPRALADRGHQVFVFLHFGEDAHLRAGGVEYRFIAPGAYARTAGRLVAAAGRSKTRPSSAGEPAFRLIRAVLDEQPEVLHVHGTTVHLNLALLHRAARAASLPVVVQHHGGALTPTPILRHVQRANLRAAARLVVSTQEQGDDFVRVGATAPGRVAIQMEMSSVFQPSSVKRARQTTDMVGRPVFLSAGRLHPIKDPMTMLAGYARIAAVWPEAHLYLHYLTDEMLEPMQAWLASRPSVRARVHFRGRLAPSDMEAVYNSTDILLQASRREFSGVAVIDAMACGVLPAVTNLPSLRAITADGAHGLHFPPGDDAALADRVLALSLEELPRRRRAVRAHFERTLSYQCMARGLVAIYEEVIEEGPSAPVSHS